MSDRREELVEQWHCFKCKEEMKEASVRMTYLKITQRAPVLKCPKCGAAYITEEMAVEKISKGEQEIESKMG